MVRVVAFSGASRLTTSLGGDFSADIRSKIVGVHGSKAQFGWVGEAGSRDNFSTTWL